MEITYSSFGERIKYLRDMLSLKQEELAKLLGISQNHVSQIEAGTRTPSKQLIKCLCYCLYLSEMWLTEGKGEIFLSPEDALKNIMARFGEQAIIEVLSKKISNETGEKIASTDIIDVANFTRRLSDKEPDLRRMIDVLYTIFSANDERLKAWASVQFDRSFPPDVVEEAQKKQKETYGQASAG